MDADDLVDTTEMYLKAVLELEEEGIVALRARIAERFGHAGPTVQQTVSRMQRDDLLVLDTDRHLRFTPRGRATASEIMRKHRLAEVFLDRVVGLDWEHVHQEACRWEHVMSDRVAALLVRLLDDPAESPYGNPIGLPAGPEQAHSTEALNLIRLAQEPAARTATIAWIGEPLQADPGLLANLRANRLVPGTRITAELHGPSVLVRAEGDEHDTEVPHEIAAHLFAVAEGAAG